MNKFKSVFLLFILIVLIHLTAGETGAQIIIEEKIEINREADSLGWWIGNCYYEGYDDSAEIDLRFTPLMIEPGEKAIMKLYYCFSGNECEYDEDSKNILDKTITLEPNYGSIIYLSHGEYEYTAPEQIPGDTAVLVTVNYTNYNWNCLADKKREDIVDCPCDPPYGIGWLGISKHYASEQILIYWDSLDVKISPSQLYAGDTAQVIIKKRNYDGTLVDFPPEQAYEVGMLDGCLLGKIRAGGMDTNYVYGVTQPIYFIADTSVTDSGDVLLRVGLIEQSRSSKLTDDADSYCFYGNFLTSSHEDAKASVENPLKILYPTKNSPDEKIIPEPEPQMPQINCKALIENYFGLVKFEWEYEVSYTYKRKKDGKDTCSRFSKSTFNATTYGFGGVVNEWIVPFTADEDNLFEFKGRDWVEGCDQVITQWDEGYFVFTGGKVNIKVTAKIMETDFVLGSKTQEANRILGDNPSEETIFNYTNSNQMKAVIWKESKFHQFTGAGLDPYFWRPYNEAGWPVYGPPGGYGLSQIDNYPTPTEKMMWHWKANVDAGKQRLQVAKNEVERYRRSVGATNDPLYIMTNVFQNYRGGYWSRYYIWQGNKWSKNSSLNDSHGKEVYDQYIFYGGGN